MLPVVQPHPRAARLERALRERVRGEVRFDAHSRLLYSTDASLYQFLPVGVVVPRDADDVVAAVGDRKSTRLNSSHLVISYAVFCLKKKKPHISANYV